ncbi:unnamed protein product, partial [Iphiclides podalirius]
MHNAVRKLVNGYTPRTQTLWPNALAQYVGPMHWPNTLAQCVLGPFGVLAPWRRRCTAATVNASWKAPCSFRENWPKSGFGIRVLGAPPRGAV